MTTAEERSRMQFREAEEWARAELPDEFAPFAASSAMTLNMLGKPVTADAVLERLRSQGRDMETLKAKDVFKECP